MALAGELHIQFQGDGEATLREWQCIVVRAGKVHRTTGVGRTVNVTSEKQGAETVFVDPAVNAQNLV